MGLVVKCDGVDCPLKETCQRYTSLSTEGQMWLVPLEYLEGECEDYIHDEIII